MNTKYKKYLSTLLIIIITITLIIKVQNYTKYGNILSSQKDFANFEEEIDFKELKQHDEDVLIQRGFKNSEINLIRDMNSKKLDLINILPTNLSSSNIQPLTYTEKDEINVGQDFINIITKVDNAIYSQENNTTYIRVLYTVRIQKPMFIMLTDNIKLMNNYWRPLFGYIKFHYVAENGEKLSEFTSFKNLIKIKLKKNNNNKDFYLSAITGMAILEASGISVISLYNEYKHNKLINKKALSQQWVNWYVEQESV